MALVTAVGKNTLLAKLIREKRWPTQTGAPYVSVGTEDDMEEHVEGMDGHFHDHDEGGVALLDRSG